jgi:hypothetical protein
MGLVREIPNSALTEKAILSPGFSVSFDGYRYWGTTTLCAQVANFWRSNYERQGLLPDNVALIRTCLFFEQRRAHWSDGYDQESLVYVRALLGRLREKVRKRKCVTGTI